MQCLSHEGSEKTQAKCTVLATKAVGKHGKGGVLATRGSGKHGKGDVLATEAVEQTRQRQCLSREGSGKHGKGGVLATKAAEMHGRGGVVTKIGPPEHEAEVPDPAADRGLVAVH